MYCVVNWTALSVDYTAQCHKVWLHCTVPQGMITLHSATRYDYTAQCHKVWLHCTVPQGMITLHSATRYDYTAQWHKVWLHCTVPQGMITLHSATRYDYTAQCHRVWLHCTVPQGMITLHSVTRYDYGTGTGDISVLWKLSDGLRQPPKACLWIDWKLNKASADASRTLSVEPGCSGPLISFLIQEGFFSPKLCVHPVSLQFTIRLPDGTEVWRKRDFFLFSFL